ncbi:glycerol-3-phosphate responsive antiterminator [Peribacillus alkalitolerans]|uniref:glycerol-3-phosphate responsive antiterminator n=1 Tax=Peribacillus alkalitolerans TaxID=1550385 RepID=UPI0013D2C6D3|nr:glycerol-3-phosphate responsive antiterminator [Peribacillus alkalitolerans]
MQRIIPTSRNMKEFERFLDSSYEKGVFLDTHVSQLRHVHQMAKQHRKKIFFHMDLIHGLKNDEFATEFVCQELKPEGIISTKGSVIIKAKQKGIVAVQRVFLIDTQALEKNLNIIEKTQPDYIEVMPGSMPWIIKEIKERIDIPIFAGGFIRTREEVSAAIEAGATAITTSNEKLWKQFEYSSFI